ncbi:MAG: phosphonate ABC transporter ATP-binding protein [Phototrophicales bacterium]|nr:MAG: phosphonate ABC transporter ATP-binding protein [Phototrophicales bacterium]
MLQIDNLRVVYHTGNEALKSVSISADKGEVIAIIGRSGAGKSTLLRCINGLQPPTSGRIILDGEEITAMNQRQLRDARRYIGFIWQEYNLVERLPAITNVLTGRLGYNRGWRSLIGYFDSSHREIALQNLERVGLMHRAKFRADKLSGGEKQRVAIARAISQEPKIILADEPVASLDPELSQQVMADLARVAREIGVLTLINIHQVDLARRFADRIIGIAQGKVEFDGAPHELNDSILDRIYRFDQPQVSHTPTA